MHSPPDQLGAIVRGSLSDGIEMRLADGCSVEDVRAGRFVVVEGDRCRFFCMVTDVRLDAAAPAYLANPPNRADDARRRILEGTGTYGTVKLRPMLMAVGEGDGSPQDQAGEPVRTVPGHFSPVRAAGADDVAAVFGSEDKPAYFAVGAPLEMTDAPVCLDLERFVERSNGVFGKSGTGKTFLTRLVLCGLIRRRQAVNLVFDMHSEYGWQGLSEGERTTVRGLKQYFPGEVGVFTLDRASSQRRGVPVDGQLVIPYSQVTAEDVVLLAHELNLNATALETSYQLVAVHGQGWLKALLDMSPADLKSFGEEYNAHPASMAALQRKLRVLTQSCKGFLRPDVADDEDAVRAVIRRLLDGRHVVVEFGQYTRPLQYMLVANILTRHVHGQYVKATEEAQSRDGLGPRPLVITIEEAHKFLAPGLAEQTIFGTIAREMRKYNVTLLVVDQRPSCIDDEVLSQVGTRLICLMDDERDVQAALSGTAGAAGLRGVLAGLETKQQALLLGHAVPMPVVVRTRTYDDEAFRTAMAAPAGASAGTGGGAERRALDLERDGSLDF